MNVKETIEEVLIDLLGVEKEQITLEARINNELGADSLDFVEVVMETEKRLDICIPDSEVAPDNITVGKFIEIVEKIVAKP